MRANVNGVELHYEIDGTGPVCFVLHGGLGLDHSLYRRSLQPLSEKLRLVFMDHRGNGQSERVPLESLSMELFADDVAGLAEVLHLDEFLVFGHSYGGFIAQELTLRHSNRVSGAIFVSTGPGKPGTTEDLSRYPLPKRPDDLLRIAAIPQVDAITAERFWQTALPHFTNAENLEELRTLMDGTMHEGPIYDTGNDLIWPAWSAVDRLAGLDIPALVVVGGRDIICAPAQSRRIADQLPNGTLVEIETGNHFPWIETPDVFYRAIEDWLDANRLL